LFAFKTVPIPVIFTELREFVESMRNSKRRRSSPMRKDRDKLKFIVNVLGPMIVFLPASPKKPGCGTTKARGLK